MFDGDLDLDGFNPDAVDAIGDAGGMIPPGKYHARLEGAAARTAKTGSTGSELVFAVLAGPFAGTEVKDTLWNSDNERNKNKLVLWGHRLGLLTVDPKTKKYVRVEGKTGFEDCLGTEVVIEVIHEPDQNDKNKKWPRLGFNLWAVGDAKVKDVPKAKAPKPGAAAPAKAATKPKVDTSNL
jgi:hypothetical protein